MYIIIIIFILVISECFIYFKGFFFVKKIYLGNNLFLEKNNTNAYFAIL